MEKLTQRELEMLRFVQKKECLYSLNSEDMAMALDLMKRGFITYAHRDPCPNAYLLGKGEQYLSTNS